MSTKEKAEPDRPKINMEALKAITKKVIDYGPSKRSTPPSTGDKSTACRPRP